MQNPEEFHINRRLPQSSLCFHPASDGRDWHFDLDLLLRALVKTNADLEVQMRWHAARRAEGMVLILDHIPDKNRSGGIGECLGEAYCQMCGHEVRPNPHEAGSPDFFPVVSESKSWFHKPTKETYRAGGFDSKGVKIQDMKFNSAKASSHHTQTSSPLVAAWNYFDGIPQIVGVFYTNQLSESDWKIGSIPKNDGAKPTSSARLLSSGLEKMRKGWLILHRSVRLPSKKNDLLDYQLDGINFGVKGAN